MVTKINAWKIIILKALKAVLLIIVLIVLIMMLFFRVVDYLSRLREPESAKVRGQELARIEGKTVVCVVGHPDDAEWYAGGTLALLAKNNKVIVIVGTSGEKGGNHLPELAREREKEQGEAGRILGYDELLFLRYPDRGLEPTNEFKDRLRGIFNENKPEILLTFDPDKQGYIYRHSDHLAAGEASIGVAREGSSIEKAYLFHSSTPDVVVDVEEVTGRKREALAAHRSQRDIRSRPPIVSFLFRVLSRLPFRTAGPSAAGSNREFPDLGIKQGEVYRLQELKR